MRQTTDDVSDTGDLGRRILERQKELNFDDLPSRGALPGGNQLP